VCQIFWTEQQRNVYVNAKFESIISPFRRFWLENTYICTCIQINTYGHIYIWTYIHMDIYTYGHVPMYIRACMYIAGGILNLFCTLIIAFTSIYSSFCRYCIVYILHILCWVT
jgi:hypothetical protein